MRRCTRILQNRYKFILFIILWSQVLNVSRGPYHTGDVSSQNMTHFLSSGPCRWSPSLSLPSVSPPSTPLAHHCWSLPPAEVYPAHYPGQAWTLAPQTPVLQSAAAPLQSPSEHAQSACLPAMRNLLVWRKPRCVQLFGDQVFPVFCTTSCVAVFSATDRPIQTQSTNTFHID